MSDIIDVVRITNFFLLLFCLYPAFESVRYFNQERVAKRFDHLRRWLLLSFLFLTLGVILSLFLSYTVIFSYDLEAMFGFIISQIVFNLRNIFLNLGLCLMFWTFYFVRKFSPD